MRRLLHLALICACVRILASCSATGCTENQNSLPLAGFYSMSTLKPITPDSIEIGGVGAPGDSLLLKASQREGKLYLPFRSADKETSYYIRYRAKALDYPELYDTITFRYESIPFFASEDCGAMFQYRIRGLDYTRHLVDSVGLADSLITNVDLETIGIYFRTSEPTDPGEGSES